MIYEALTANSKIKPTKKMKEIPSRHFLENLQEKASTSETHWQFTGIITFLGEDYHFFWGKVLLGVIINIWGHDYYQHHNHIEGLHFIVTTSRE